MRVGLLGAGHVGCWLVKELGDEHQIAYYDPGTPFENLPAGVKRLEDPGAFGGFEPELLINAVTRQNSVIAFQRALDVLPPDCCLADVAALKGELVEFYRGCGHPFVSVHPMFIPPGESGTPLPEENAVIVAESDPVHSVLFERLFERLKLSVHRCALAEHDQLMGYVLGTPFIASLVFAASLEDTVVPGANFQRHLRLAQGLLQEDDQLLTDALCNEHTIKTLRVITGKLEYLKHILDAGDTEEATKLFVSLRGRLLKADE